MATLDLLHLTRTMELCEKLGMKNLETLVWGERPGNKEISASWP